MIFSPSEKKNADLAECSPETVAKPNLVGSVFVKTVLHQPQMVKVDWHDRSVTKVWQMDKHGIVSKHADPYTSLSQGFILVGSLKTQYE